MEKLYNGITLNDNFTHAPSDALHVPYLENPPEVIDVSLGRQLFVDDFLIEETTLTPSYHKAKKFEGNPVLFPETPWENEISPCACPKSGGVWYDEKEKIYKMWYEATWLKNMCYATSKDGINWERPSLDVEPGTNKILTYEGFDKNSMEPKDISYLRPDSTTVFIDYEAPANERYKLFLRTPGGVMPGIAAVSKDGIHFEKFTHTPPMYDRSTVFYNPFRKKWVYSIRSSIFPPEGGFKRVRLYRECDDYIKGALWEEDDAKLWLMADSEDKPNPYIGKAPELYNVDAIGYESIMLGMFQIYYGPSNEACETTGAPKITELQAMYSRDGYHYSRPSRDAFINASMHKGSWDRGYVQSVGGGVIIDGDELKIYYIGFGGDENYSHQSWVTNGMYRYGATGIATLRRDGFVSMDGDGTLLTRKLTFSGKSDMYVNALGKVKAELLDEEGSHLSEAFFEGDSTKAHLDFENLSISELNGKTFRIRFTVKGSLYSFGFADEKGDFGGAHGAGIVK